MRPIRIFLSCMPIVIILALTCTTAASAATTQWFPVDGTNCDYLISQSTSYNNNTNIQTNLFNVYNVSGYFYLIPTAFHTVVGPAYKSIKNDTQVIWRYSYKSLSSTQLNRTAEIVIGNETYTSSFIYIGNVPGYDMPRSTASIIIQKDNFYTTGLSEEFLDYFNCTAHVGDHISPGFTLLTNDGVQEIAVYNITFPTEYYTVTFIANESGRVTKCVISDYDTTDYGFSNAHGSSVAFEALIQPSSTGSSIPGYSIGIILDVVAIAFVSLFMIRKKKFQH